MGMVGDVQLMFTIVGCLVLLLLAQMVALAVVARHRIRTSDAKQPSRAWQYSLSSLLTLCCIVALVAGGQATGGRSHPAAGTAGPNGRHLERAAMVGRRWINLSAATSSEGPTAAGPTELLTLRSRGA